MPTVSLVSSVFAPLAEGEALGLGLPELGVVTVPHPVATRSFDELVATGAEQGPEVISLLTINTDEVGSER